MRKANDCRRGFLPRIAHRIREGLFPVLAGTALFLLYPSLISHQDVASLVRMLPAGEAAQHEGAGKRWLASISEAPGMSRLLPGGEAGAAVPADPITTASTGTGASLGGEMTTGLRVEREPQRVNREAKGSRVVSAPAKAPPRGFTAGSVLELQSLLQPLELPSDVELAFVPAKPVEEALQVASLFNLKQAPHELLGIDPDLPVTVASLVEESASNILAYAPEPTLKRSPFAAVLNEQAPISIIPRLDARDHDWAAEPLPASAFSDSEQHCLAAGIYFEARGEPVRGQAAVAQVILNRVKNPTYPDTICGVVYQNQSWRNRCQFSFACDHIKDVVRDKPRWEIATYVARETTEGRIWLKEVGSSTHYHATYVSPKWARSMERVGRIGLHIFYRTYGGGWS